MSEPKEECWSVDGSDYRYDTLGELLDCNDDIEVGQVVHVGEKNHPDPASFVDADDVIEQIACRGSDVGGEWAEDYPDVTKEARDELTQFLEAWARKHCQPTFYSIENEREYEITAEHLVGRT